MHTLIVVVLVALISACATTPQKPPEIARISPEELARIMPKPVPNLSTQELVELSKQGVPPDEIIRRIKDSHSQYALNAQEVVALSQQGVDAKVLDFIQQAREEAIRDSFADEINKREREKQQQQQQLKRQYEMDRFRYYDPWWGYPYGMRPWGGPYWGPSVRFRYGF